MAKANAIGIDLGATYSCVGVFMHGKVEIIANDQGNRTTPSYVAFTDNERLIGDAAKNQTAMNPSNTVFDVNRLIGRKFDDKELKEEMQHWPFKVTRAEGSRLKVQVKEKGETKDFFPEDISSMILVKMRETAEAFLGGGSVKKAVITVPAYFNDSQRQAIENAGALAGLNVLRIISEPTAAAIAYGLDKKGKTTRNVLFYDLGVRAFTATIYECEKKVSTQKSTKSIMLDSKFAFDNLMVEYFEAEFKRMHNKVLRHRPRAFLRLQTACERAKQTLSATTRASVEIESLIDGISYYSAITRTEFERRSKSFIWRTMSVVEDALEKAFLQPSDIDDIVLIGGQTHIPQVQQLLSKRFWEKLLTKSIMPEFVGAMGAAIEAAKLNAGDIEEVRERPKGKVKSNAIIDSSSVSSSSIETDDEATAAPRMPEPPQPSIANFPSLNSDLLTSASEEHDDEHEGEEGSDNNPEDVKPLPPKDDGSDI